MKSLLLLASLLTFNSANAIVTAEVVGKPGQEETFLTILQAHDDEDIQMVSFANVFDNPGLNPSRLDLSSLSDRVYPVSLNMMLGMATQLDYLILNSPANRAVLAEMIPDPNVKVMGVKIYSIRYVTVRFEKPRMAGEIPIGGMRMQGLKSITFKTATGFVFEMDLDPDQELYRYLSMMSAVPLDLPDAQGAYGISSNVISK